MNLIYIGKLVNTHGLKGEVKIISDFKYKDVIFKVNNNIYINDKKYIIKSYRKHKIYDMVILSDINNIDDALEIKGNNVYIDKDEYKFDGYLDEEIIGLDVYDEDIHKGKVIDIYKTNHSDMLVIEGKKRHLIPYRDEFIDKIDIKNNKIYINYIKGLDNED